MSQKRISSFFKEIPSSSSTMVPKSKNSSVSVSGSSPSCVSADEICVVGEDLTDQVQLHPPVAKLARSDRTSNDTGCKFAPAVIEAPSPVNITSNERNVNKSDRCYLKKWENAFPWLYEDRTRGGAFCKLCEVYAKDDRSLLHSTGGVFIKTPFNNYKKALGKDGRFTKHAQSASHIKSVEMEKLRLEAKNRPIHSQMLNQSKVERNRNRESMCLLLRGVYFLAKEEIAHSTKYEPLVDCILRKANPNLDEWVSSQSERSTYISRNTASELICSVGEVLEELETELLKDKKFALMADESTSVKNESALSICVRYVSDGVPVEMFLCICKLIDTKAETIANQIDQQLKKRNLSYNNLVACGFDGAANMSGKKGGVRRLLSLKANRDLPYIHCRAHILSLALTRMRNKHGTVKRVFYVLKDIYKLFHMSPKREATLHNIQAMLNDPILKIPEAIEIRWLSHYKIVHAVVLSYVPILTTCEHLHKDGADLASLAGGILLELQKQSFLVTLCGLHEALGAVSNLSLELQKSEIHASMLPTMITSTLSHLKSISSSCSSDCEDSNSIIKSVNLIKTKAASFRPLLQDETNLNALKNVKTFTDGMVKEMSKRFNDTALALINGCALFESYTSLLNASDEDIVDLCKCFNGNGINLDGVQTDFKSFKYYAIEKLKEENPSAPLVHLLQAQIGYTHLKQLAELVMCIPVATAGVERSFSSMNRILTKLRNRMGEETLDHCMRISIEGPENPSEDLVNKVLDNYARKKPRRIRLL